MEVTKIKRIQQISLILLDEFARVCRENNLQWFVDSGTLLGAIRHGGFIPWDDDVDVAMPREDYSRLVSISKDVFKYPFQFAHRSVCPCVAVYAQLKYCESAKITERNLTSYYRDNSGHFTENLGIGMDIVPLDNIPNNNEQMKDLMKFTSYIRESSQVMHYNCGTYERSITHSKNKDAVDLLDSIMTKVNSASKDTGRVACVDWWMFYELRGYTVSKDCYSSYTEQKFKGMQEMVRVPIGYDEILRKYYGNYKHEEVRITEQSYKKVIIDDTHSYRDYEKLSVEMLEDMIDKDKDIDSYSPTETLN